jgi:hypothetical protein
MTTRVNLLQAAEFRRQGLVSTVFIIRVSIMTVVLFFAVFGFLTLLQYRNSRQQLASAREIWKAREPAYRKTLVMKQDLATKRKLDQELLGWQVSRTAWEGPLAALRQIAPPSLQFRRLNIRGEMDVRVPKVKAAKEGGRKAGGAEKAAGEPPAGMAGGKPARLFFLLIEGRTSGDQAEDVVLQFDAALRRAPAFRALLQSVRLQRLEIEEAGSEKSAGQAFAIEAATGRREML